MKALQKSTILGGGKGKDDVYVHLVLILASSKNDPLLQCIIDPSKYYTAF